MNNNPFLDNYTSRFFYTSIWVLFAIIQMLLLYYTSDVDWKYLLADSAVFNSLQAFCILVLWYPVRYYRSIVSIPLFLLFHILLIVISSVGWIGAGWLLMNLFTSQDTVYQSFFFQFLPFRVYSGLFVYIVAVLSYYLLIMSSELKKQKEIEQEETLPEVEERLSRIAIKKKQEVHIIPVEQVIYFEADGDYVHIHTVNGRFLKDKTMKYWENNLPLHLFVRIHRSYIINVEYIAKIELYEKESYRVQLKGGACLNASSSGYKLLKQRVQF